MQPADVSISYGLTSISRRVQKFRADYAELKSQFEKVKNEVSRSRRLMCQTHGFYRLLHREPPHSGTNYYMELCQVFSRRAGQMQGDASHQVTSTTMVIRPSTPSHHFVCQRPYRTKHCENITR